MVRRASRVQVLDKLVVVYPFVLLRFIQAFNERRTARVGIVGSAVSHYVDPHLFAGVRLHLVGVNEGLDRLVHRLKN